MEWSIQEVVEATGVTSRTLRHYDQVGLLVPTRRDQGGRRYYDHQALLRLQRILLLRELGLSLPAIADVLDGAQDDIAALQEHRKHLVVEKQRIATQIRSVETTIAALQKGKQLMPKDMFEGFDHTKYETEARERWGDEAVDRSNAWWSELGADQQAAFMQEVEELNAAWDRVIASGVAPESEPAQAIAARHVEWLKSATRTSDISHEMVTGITQLYVDDERFAANYNRVSATGPQFVRDAVHCWADHHLSDGTN